MLYAVHIYTTKKNKKNKKTIIILTLGKVRLEKYIFINTV